MKSVSDGGKLADRPTYKIIRDLVQQKSTGTLILQSTSDTIVITFEFGLCVAVESHYPKPEYMLGQLILQRNWITESQLDEIIEEQKNQLKRFGVVARSMGLISAIQLMEVLEDQMLLVLFPSLTWTQGLYYFRSEETAYYDRSSSRPLDLTEIILSGEKILKNNLWLAKRFPSMDLVPSLIPNVEVVPPGVQIDRHPAQGQPVPVVLTSEQEKVYGLINGLSSISRIISTCHQLPWLSLIAFADLEDAGVITVPAETPEKQTISINRTFFIEIIKRNFKHIAYGLAAVLLLVFLLIIPSQFFPAVRSGITPKEKMIFSKQRLEQIAFSLRVFAFRNGHYPTYLSELVDAGITENEYVIDMWENKFYYKKQRSGYLLICSGPDESWATEDDIQIQEDSDQIDSPSFFPNWNRSNKNTGPVGS